MVKQVTRWETEDGKLFDTKEAAEYHSEIKVRMQLIRDVLGFELWEYYGEEIYEFIETYTKGWK